MPSKLWSVAGGLFPPLVTLLVVVLALPLEEGMRVQPLSLIGIVLSTGIALSSTTFLGKAMGGLMLRAVRNFKTGDFISVGEHFGQVSERGLFHTEIQTEDRDVKQLVSFRSGLRKASMDALHGATFMTTRSLAPEVQVVPRGTARDTHPLLHEAPDAVIFDKADEAEALVTRHKRLAELAESVDAAKKELAANKDEAARARLETNVTHLEARHGALEREVDARKDLLRDLDED